MFLNTKQILLTTIALLFLSTAALNVSAYINITLYKPDNNTWLNYTLINFTYKPVSNDSYNITNCSLVTNESGWPSFVMNDTTISNNTNNTFTYSISSGIWIWNIRCYNNNSEEYWAPENWTVKVDTTAPSCSLQSITESSDYAFVSGTTIYYNNASSGNFTVNISTSEFRIREILMASGKTCGFRMILRQLKSEGHTIGRTPGLH